mmetsp:Transcript_61507/g.121720  ORF Transcript_61507/g.121720 Transcript_61507/m.121720 type:complete len:131 (-) Transcript_61507:135-527(-)
MRRPSRLGGGGKWHHHSRAIGSSLTAGDMTLQGGTMTWKKLGTGEQEKEEEEEETEKEKKAAKVEVEAVAKRIRMQTRCRLHLRGFHWMTSVMFSCLPSEAAVQILMLKRGELLQHVPSTQWRLEDRRPE